MRTIDRPFVRTLVAAALIVGIAERIVWAAIRCEPFATGEAVSVAVALAQGRGFADAFAPGQGPTAHLLPVAPFVASLVYRSLGVHSVASEAALLGWSLALVFGCYLLFGRAMARVGTPAPACLAGFALLCVAPVYTTFEAFDFRVWEGALGLLLGGLLLAVLLAAEDGVIRRGTIVGLAVLPAIAFFVSPPVGLAAMLSLALFLVRRRHVVPSARILIGLMLALALLIGPWTARNCVVMGRCVWLRDNLGLELAVANHPAAVAPADPDQTFYDRLVSIHPYIHPPAYRAMMRAGGEIAYADRMGAEAKAWIAGHPRDAAALWMRHAREMVFTRSWMFHTTHGVWLPVFRATLVTLLALLALVRLAIASVRREGRYLYPAIYLLVPVACYIPFQPIPRYTWLIYPVLAYLASDAVAWLIRAARGSPP